MLREPIHDFQIYYFNTKNCNLEFPRYVTHHDACQVHNKAKKKAASQNSIPYFLFKSFMFLILKNNIMRK